MKFLIFILVLVSGVITLKCLDNPTQPVIPVSALMPEAVVEDKPVVVEDKPVVVVEEKPVVVEEKPVVVVEEKPVVVEEKKPVVVEEKKPAVVEEKKPVVVEEKSVEKPTPKKTTTKMSAPASRSSEATKKEEPVKCKCLKCRLQRLGKAFNRKK